MPTLSWIHISDLHFRESIAWDGSPVLKSLLTDITKVTEQYAITPSFVVVSGDIAFSGKASEYKKAGDFLDQLLKITKLPKNRLFIAPGNHDVDRAFITQDIIRSQKTLKDRTSISEVLLTPAKAKMFFKRFRGYSEFIREYLGSKSFLLGDGNYGTTVFTAGEIRTKISCLNSAWLSQEQNERNKLCIGEPQADITTKGGGALRIAVFHHPLNWLTPFDSRDVEPILYGNNDFLLVGHAHYPEFVHLSSPDYEATVIVGGAAYETRVFQNNYNIVSIDSSTGKGLIRFRGFSSREGGFWANDSFAYRGAPDGNFHFELSSGLKRRLGTKTTESMDASPEQPRSSRVDLSRVYDAMMKMTLENIRELVEVYLRNKCRVIPELEYLATELDPDNLPKTKREYLLALVKVLGAGGERVITELLNFLQQRRPDIYSSIVE